MGNQVVAEKVSDERLKELEYEFLQERKIKLVKLISVLSRFDRSNQYWYKLNQEQKNYLIDNWSRKVCKKETDFCKGRKINIINNWINNILNKKKI